MSNWEVYIEYKPAFMSTFMYVFRKADVGKVQFLTMGGSEIQTVDKGAEQKDDIYFAKFDDGIIVNLMIEALDKRGIKAPPQSYVEGRLEAIQDHLQDLRQLIPELVNKQSRPKK